MGFVVGLVGIAGWIRWFLAESIWPIFADGGNGGFLDAVWMLFGCYLDAARVLDAEGGLLCAFWRGCARRFGKFMNEK